VSGSFSYTPTEAHLTAAYRLHWPTGLNWKLLVFIALLALAVAILLAREGPFRLQDIAATTIGGTFGGLAAGLVIQWMVTKFWIPIFARRIYRQQADLKLETRMEWDDQGFRATNSEGEGITRWAGFHRWKRGPNMLLLYRSDVLFNFVPLSGPGSQTDGDEIVSFLRAAKVPEREP
jgi:YcxB-like protein